MAFQLVYSKVIVLLYSGILGKLGYCSRDANCTAALLLNSWKKKLASWQRAIDEYESMICSNGKRAAAFPFDILLILRRQDHSVDSNVLKSKQFAVSHVFVVCLFNDSENMI